MKLRLWRTKMIYVETLSEFIEWTSQFKDGQYLFRGVPNEKYKIEASAYLRLPQADRNNPDKLLKINQELIQKAQTLGHDQKNGQSLSDLELLAELHHFGAATCLIDFTRSALIALWFACQQSTTGEANGKVFAVNRGDTVLLKTVNPELTKKNIDYFLKPDENNRYLLYQWEPKLQNNRMIAQQSVFLLSGAQIEAEIECVIIKSSKPEILESLNKLSGITEVSMYPDFEGFAYLHTQNKPYIHPNAHEYLQRGIEADQNDNRDAAIKFYTEVISLDSDTSIALTAYRNRGVAYGIKGEVDRAVVDFTKAIELNPNDAKAYYNRGVTHGIKGEVDHAIVDFTTAIDLRPDNANIYYNRGFAYNIKGDYDRAIVDYTKAIELNPDSAGAYYNRGIAYNSKGDYDDAIVDFTTAIELDTDSAGAYYNRGFAYNIKGDYDDAIVDFTTAIELNPDFARAYYSRGFAYNSKGDYDRAIVDYTKVIELDPDSAGAYYNRGFAYNSKGDYDRAIVDYTKVIELDPDSAGAYYNRGFAYNSKGDYDDAIVDFTTAIELDTDSASAFYNRGVARLHLGEWERAKSDLTVARDMEVDIITAFRYFYESVSDFEGKHGVELPTDIAAMLTPLQA